MTFAVSALIACAGELAAADEAEQLVFSGKTWQGEYYSKDIPGGGETSPAASAVYTIKSDGSGLSKIVDLGKETTAPAFSPDGQWIYFQSNATGHYHIYRCRP